MGLGGGDEGLSLTCFFLCAQPENTTAATRSPSAYFMPMHRLCHAYFFSGVAEAVAFLGNTGLTNSVRQMGPSANPGPSARTNVGQSPPKTQTIVSGGCLPIASA